MIKPGRQGVDVLVANYHAPEMKNLEDSVNLLKRYGVQKVRIQKEVFDAELYFRLLTLAKMGDLERMTQYKASKDEDKTGQLLTYPVLMAHDVAGYSEVIVGLDQKQHLEYARKLLRKHNSKFGSDYPLPTPNIIVGRIKDLFLDDTPEVIRKKLRKATADEAGLENLRFLHGEFVGGEIPESNERLKEELSEGLMNCLANL